MYQYALSLGIDIRLSSTVTDYWENCEEAGVFVNGTRLVADCVICADGIHSQGRGWATGQQAFDEEPGSAFSAFRGVVRTEELRKDPQTAEFVQQALDGEDFFRMWVENGVHFSFFTAQRGELLVWFAARKVSFSPTLAQLPADASCNRIHH